MRNVVVALAVWTSLVACGDEVVAPAPNPSETNPDAPLVGQPCSFLCGGPACNLRCEDDILYRCTGTDTFVLEEDCVAMGQQCVFVDSPNIEEVDRRCE